MPALRLSLSVAEMATLAAAASPQRQQQENARALAVVENDSASPSSIVGVDRNQHRQRRKPDAFDDERFDAVAFVNEMFPTGAF